MDIVSQDRIGKNVLCRVRHEVTGDERLGWVNWNHAYDGGTVNTIKAIGPGRLAGPWKILELDAPFSA